MNKRIEVLLWIAAFAAIVLLGRFVLDPPKSEETAEQKVRIGYVSWAEGIAMTYLSKVILEEEMGYSVDLVMADPAPIFTSLANGDLDFFLDAWLPVTHQTHMKKYKGRLVKLGVTYEGARIGLVVPSYVDVDTIPQLGRQAETFDNAITGIDSGAGIMEATGRAIDSYSLGMKLLTSSGAAMTASLKDAVAGREPIVVTGWKPHWMFARWDLKFLEDPKTMYGKAENIYTVGRLGISEDMPEVVSFFTSMRFNDQQIGTLMDAMQQDTTQEEAARKWIEEHRELVDSWKGE